MKDKFHIFRILINTAIFALVVQCDQLYFSRIFQCLDPSTTSCVKWNDTTYLTYDRSFFAFNCFPENATVLTQENIKKKMNELTVGDKILAYDFESKKNVFSEINAWLHRETEGYLEFTKILSKDNLTYTLSAAHNIAFEKQGIIQFKFAANLIRDEALVTAEGQKRQIEAVKSSQMQKGLFSPFTIHQNFYIYPNVLDNTTEESMVLVHCLSQTKNPKTLQPWIGNLMWLFGLFGVNQHQSLPIDNYLHPLTYILNIISEKGKKIKYKPFQSWGSKETNSNQLIPIGQSPKGITEVDPVEVAEEQQMINQRLAILFSFLCMQSNILSNY